MSPAGHESCMKYDYDSGSRRPFEALTSAFDSIFKTPLPSILLGLKSEQITEFCNLKQIK